MATIADVRPVPVTVAGLLTLLAGFVSVWSGIGPLDSDLTDPSAWLSVAAGVVTVVVAYGVLAGWRSARALVTLVELAQVTVAVRALAGGRVDAWTIGDLVLGVVVLVLLWLPASHAFFRADAHALVAARREAAQSSGRTRPRSGTASEV
ncbi:hypothetical protein [Cellulomonas massiliensis]|uniref:hypothetical protein n=1 Tax=Cellulomonas massiliensis TaxID=1465811 RepID=UPI000382A2A9|nr:hypothetical protein [Cellulomonas massiliensis]